MFVLSWLYFSANITQTIAAAAFLGVQPAVIALIVRAVHRIGSHVLLDNWLWCIAVVAGLAALAGAPFWLTLPLAGAACVFGERKLALPAGLILAALVAIGLYFAWKTYGGLGAVPAPAAA